MLDDRQTVIAAKRLAVEKLDARNSRRAQQLVDFVRQPADLRLFHLHRAQLDAIVGGNSPDVADDAFAVFERAVRQPVEGLARCGNRLVRVGEEAEASLITAARRGAVSVIPQTRKNLFHNASQKCFVDLHGD